MKGKSSLFNYGPGFSTGKIEYSPSKMDDYLLNLESAKGKSKAQFLKDVLGYVKGDGKQLHDALINAINGKEPSKVTKTDYGIKYEYDVKIGGKNGTTAKVIVVYQQDNGKDSYRIITLYPGKKE